MPYRSIVCWLGTECRWSMFQRALIWFRLPLQEPVGPSIQTMGSAQLQCWWAFCRRGVVSLEVATYPRAPRFPVLMDPHREAGECQWCPTGVVCSVEGMVNPCSKGDLPTPFEPVVSVNNIPMLEYLYSEFARPPYFSGYECLHLNDGYADGTLDPVDQVRGEPPVVDKGYICIRYPEYDFQHPRRQVLRLYSCWSA